MSHPSKTKTLLNNHLDSFQNFSSAIGGGHAVVSSTSVVAPTLSNPTTFNSSESPVHPQSKQKISSSTFSVSDYFENNIASRNLRRDARLNGGMARKLSNGEELERRRCQDSGTTAGWSQNDNNEAQSGTLSATASPSPIQSYQPSKRMTHFLQHHKDRDGLSQYKPVLPATTIQATTRTIGSPAVNLFQARTPQNEKRKRNGNDANIDNNNTSPLGPSELSPVQKRAMNMDRRVELVEMRSRQLQWMKTYQREKDSMRDEISVLRQTKQDVQKERAQLMSEMKQMDKSLHALKEQNALYQKQVDELHMQNNMIKDQLNQKHAEGLQPLADEYNRLTQQSRKELKETQEKLMELQEQSKSDVQDKVRQIKELHEQIEEYESKMEVLTSRLEILHDQNLQLKQQQDSDVGSLQEQLSSLRKQHDTLQLDNNSLSEQVSQLNAQNAKQKKQIESLQTSNQSLLDSEMKLRQRFTQEVTDRDTRIKQLEQENELKVVNANISKLAPDTMPNAGVNPSTLQNKLLRICTNLTTIESLIPGISAQRNDDIDEYDLSDLASFVEKQSSRVCRIIREKIEEETENQLGGPDDCVIS